jgi:hypothetical protein
MRSLGVLSITLTLSLVIGCDAMAPVDAPEETRSPGVESAALQLALEDVLVRILPSLGDAATRGSLETQVAELVSALAAGDTGRLSRALLATHEALELLAGSPEVGEEHGADLSAIQLVLEQLATSSGSPAPLEGVGPR